MTRQRSGTTPSRATFPATFLATVLTWPTMVVATVLLGLAAMVLGWIPPRGRWMLRCARLWSRIWLTVSGLRVTASGGQGIEPGRGYVFLSNHVSWFDIPVLLATVPSEVRFAAKRGLFQVPILGWALHAGGFIAVDRGDKTRARDVFAAAIERLRAGNSVLFFPEGTRSRDGRLQPFQRGGFLLALKSGLPIVPVGIEGTYEVMPRTRLSIRPGRVEVRYGEPIDVEAYGLRGRRRLMEEVRRQIAALARVEMAGEVEDEEAPS